MKILLFKSTIQVRPRPTKLDMRIPMMLDKQQTNVEEPTVGENTELQKK